MKTIKVSYTALKGYFSYQKDIVKNSMDRLLGKKPAPIVNEYIVLGQKWDKKWTEIVKETKRIPKMFKFDIDDQFEPQVWLEEEVWNHNGIRIILMGVSDALGKENVVDFKCSAKSPSYFLGSRQLEVYSLLSGRDIKMGVYMVYNPYEKTISNGILFMDDKSAFDARQWVVKSTFKFIKDMNKNKIKWWREEWIH